MSRVAIRYSKALFDLAHEKNLIEAVQADLVMIKEVCLGNADFQNALANPVIEEYVKAKLLKELFEDKLNPLTFKFLQLLSKKKRSGFLLEMIDQYLERVLDYQGILSGLIISAKSLDHDQIESVKHKIEELTEKTVLLSEQIDDSMVGGFIVKIKDTVIDLSIKTQLEKLRTQLAGG